MSEGETTHNPIEDLEEGTERRFVVGLNAERKAISELIVARDGIDIIPLRQNHAKLADMALGLGKNRAGGFCMRTGDEIIRMTDLQPTLVTEATDEQFQDALKSGVRIIEPPNP